MSSSRHKSILVTGEVIGDHVNLLVAGELNSGTSPRLEAEVRRFIAQGHNKVVMSLENVSLVTSAGLRVLLVLAKEIRQSGGNVALYDCQPNVLEIFRMTGFDSILLLTPSYEEAVFEVGASLVTFGEHAMEQVGKPTFH